MQAGGFREVKQNITLLADQALTVNVNLTLGSNTEMVTVTGYDLQVDTTTATLKQVVEGQRIVGLPLNGRNVAQLTLTAPGVVNSPNGGRTRERRRRFREL